MNQGQVLTAGTKDDKSLWNKIFGGGPKTEDNFQLVSSSQHNRSAHRPTHRLLVEGDILLAEITPSIEGEFAQICRTAVLGEPTPMQHAAFALLDDALRAGMAAARPGVSVADVVAATNDNAKVAGAK